jgi:hypothetical protein
MKKLITPNGTLITLTLFGYRASDTAGCCAHRRVFPDAGLQNKPDGVERHIPTNAKRKM